MRIAAEMTVPPRRFLGFCERVEDYAKGCEPGVEVVGFTSGEFSIIDVISAVVRRRPGARLVLSTWTAAGAEMQHVEDFVSAGLVSAARWIVDRSFKNRQPALCESLRRRFGDEAVRVQRVHCKFALVEGDGGGVTIQTSANLNRNARIENVSVSSCPVLFSAYSQLVADIFETQMPGAGFESAAAVSSAFRDVAKRKARKRTVPKPW
jgi:hypothetical protein